MSIGEEEVSNASSSNTNNNVGINSSNNGNTVVAATTMGVGTTGIMKASCKDYAEKLQSNLIDRGRAKLAISTN